MNTEPAMITFMDKKFVRRPYSLLVIIFIKVFQIAWIYWRASTLEVYQSGCLIQSIEIKVMVILKMEAAGSSEVLVTTPT